MRIVRFSLAVVFVLMAGTFMHAQNPTTLAALRDHKRVLLIFGGDSDPRVDQQWNTMVQHRGEAAERDLVTVRLTRSAVKLQDDQRPSEGSFSQTEERTLRTRFHIDSNTFAVVLIGKDGGEKLRSKQPIPWDTLESTIDAMPMRQTEMRRSR